MITNANKPNLKVNAFSKSIKIEDIIMVIISIVYLVYLCFRLA